jgi:quercetin dioxygenase-like cupin family protein
LWSAFGDSIRALLTPDDTGAEVFVGHMEPPAGYGPPLHVHLKEDEIFIVEQGTFEFTIRDEVVQVGPGTVVYGPRNIPHTWRAVGEELNRATVLSVPANFGTFFERCAQAFANGEPNMAEVMRIADEHGLLFVSPEEAAVYPEPQGSNVPQPKIVKQDEGLHIGSGGERGRAILLSG